jgi:hypothetical protein
MKRDITVATRPRMWCTQRNAAWASRGHSVTSAQSFRNKWDHDDDHPGGVEQGGYREGVGMAPQLLAPFEDPVSIDDEGQRDHLDRKVQPSDRFHSPHSNHTMRIGN